MQKPGTLWKKNLQAVQEQENVLGLEVRNAFISLQTNNWFETMQQIWKIYTNAGMKYLIYVYYSVGWMKIRSYSKKGNAHQWKFLNQHSFLYSWRHKFSYLLFVWGIAPRKHLFIKFIFNINTILFRNPRTKRHEYITWNSVWMLFNCRPISHFDCWIFKETSALASEKITLRDWNEYIQLNVADQTACKLVNVCKSFKTAARNNKVFTLVLWEHSNPILLEVSSNTIY